MVVIELRLMTRVEVSQGVGGDRGTAGSANTSALFTERRWRRLGNQVTVHCEKLKSWLTPTDPLLLSLPFFHLPLPLHPSTPLDNSTSTKADCCHVWLWLSCDCDEGKEVSLYKLRRERYVEDITGRIFGYTLPLPVYWEHCIEFQLQPLQTIY